MNSDEETPTTSPPKLVPTTTTTVKPPSTWLQRLYTSKGFQDSDHFLSNKIDPPTHHTIPTKNIPQKHTNNNNNENQNGSDLINNILSELFCMGDYENPTRIIKKKITRKQHCPRFYVVPKNPDTFEKVNVSVPQNPGVVRKVKVSVPQIPDAFGKVKVPVPLTLTGEKKVRVKVKVKRREVVEEEEEEEEEGEDWDASGYSQTEVTVIDTSVSDWKFDRVLYRKKKTNVWKVGDTKGKGVLRNCGFGNKRKRDDNENVNDVYKKKKKLKFREENDVEKKIKKKKKLIFCNSLSYVDMDGGAPMVRMKSAQGHEQGPVVVAAFKLKQDNCSQAL
uniref:uncharacterized protein LOC122585262 isoform X1 n=1 Tax=Erigeron canadensis TaxID=72917 RepID=UPI001CB9C588|nr:uncharacterized protein LOC122585262 isoform X1 [Erigeron canadensis]